MNQIFILNNASRAAGYGIGTYVTQLTDGLSVLPETKVSMVEMYADTKEFTWTDDDKGIRHYQMPPLKSHVENETYCRILFYLLARNMETAEDDHLIFQFNYFQHYPLALQLKAWFPKSKIVFTVHYLNWCFELKGNVKRMRDIMNAHDLKDDAERGVRASIESERQFLHLADTVIALSRRTEEILVEDYKVLPEKIHLIYNGAGGSACSHMVHDAARQILFVARLDEIKGLKYLIEAFGRMADKHQDVHLAIVGDGDFQPYMAQARKYPGRISFFGKMKPEEVEVVYRTAYVGVMPSFHEQCSYTAIELMRHGIPIVGTDSTGLSEMLDATPTLRVHIDEVDFDEEGFISRIADRLDLLLSDDEAYNEASRAVSRLYEERYTVPLMTAGVQRAVMTTTDHVVPSDFLPHMDDRMIDLINRHPDIDMGFYGLGGIGIYLWWRVLQLEKEGGNHADRLALIKEHLVYCLDWMQECVLEEGPLSVELSASLTSMMEHSFYPTKVAELLKHATVIDIPNCLPPECDILHNALRIISCKI